MKNIKNLTPIDIVNKYNRYGIVLTGYDKNSLKKFYNNARQQGIANRFFDSNVIECEEFICNAINFGKVFLCFCDEVNNVNIYVFDNINLAKEFVANSQVNMQDDVHDDMYDGNINSL